MRFLSIPAQAIIRFNFIVFIYFWILRAAFAFIFVANAPQFKTSEFLKSFYLGMKFDVRMTLLLTIPLALLLIFFRFEKNKVRKYLARIYYPIFLVVTTIMFLDIGFYSYLNSRINSSVTQFAQNPLISLQMMWETYPILTILFFIFLTTTVLHFVLKRFVFSLQWQHTPFRMNIASSLIVVIFYLIGLYGKFSYYPLRWSEAFYTDNPYLIAMGIHPILYFNDTMKASRVKYDQKKVENSYDTMAEYLKIPIPDKSKLHFERPVIPTPLNFTKTPNVVVIILESMGSYKTHQMKHPLNPTPFLKELSDESVLFNRYFTPTEGTARGVFGIVSGLPDVSTYKTASRNPLVSEQNSAARALSGFDKYYFLGGSANWGEIRGVIGRSIPGIKIFEEGSYESPRVDVWGISDLNLFDEANKVFTQRQSEDPFFAIIQTSGFHRPYTIPGDNRGFKIENISDEEAKKYGFVSAAEFNSLRFQDHSLRQFFETAKKQPYFANTLFVLTADHGLPDFNAKHLPKYYKDFSLSRFHSPLIFHSKTLFPEPEVKETLASSQDILVTLSGLLGLDFYNKGMGRNLFSEIYDRYAFMYTYHSVPPGITLMGDQYIVTGNIKKGITGLYDYTSETPKKNLKNSKPETYKKLKDLAESIFETSRYMLYHNSPSTSSNDSKLINLPIIKTNLDEKEVKLNIVLKTSPYEKANIKDLTYIAIKQLKELSLKQFESERGRNKLKVSIKAEINKFLEKEYVSDVLYTYYDIEKDKKVDAETN